MNKLAFLPLLILPACASPGENARLMQAALDHDKGICIARGAQPGTDGYTRCMVKLGHREHGGNSAARTTIRSAYRFFLRRADAAE